MSDGTEAAKGVAGNDAARRTAKEAAGGDENALAPSRQRPPRITAHQAAWDAAVLANANGHRIQHPKFKPVGLDADGLFKTAEDAQNLMDLHTVPDTIEAYTIPYSSNKQPVLIKYCLVPLRNYLELSEAARFGDIKTVLIDGQERFVHTPTALKDKRRLRKGKIPTLTYLGPKN